MAVKGVSYPHPSVRRDYTRLRTQVALSDGPLRWAVDTTILLYRTGGENWLVAVEERLPSWDTVHHHVGDVVPTSTPDGEGWLAYGSAGCRIYGTKEEAAIALARAYLQHVWERIARYRGSVLGSR